MKRISYLLSLMLLMGLTLFTACGKDAPKPNEKTPEELKTEQLTSAAFTISSVKKGEETVTIDPAAVITFKSDGTYSLTNGSNLPTPVGSTMAATGTWVFKDKDNFDEITLTPTGSAAIELTTVSLTDNSLTFSYPGVGVKAESEPVTVAVTATR